MLDSTEAGDPHEPPDRLLLIDHSKRGEDLSEFEPNHFRIGITDGSIEINNSLRLPVMETGGLENHRGPPVGGDFIHFSSIELLQFTFSSLYKSAGRKILSISKSSNRPFQHLRPFAGRDIVCISCIHVHCAPEASLSGPLYGLAKGLPRNFAIIVKR